MENEIKRLEKNKSVTIVVMLVIMLAIVLSACTVLSGGDTEICRPQNERSNRTGKNNVTGGKIR